MSVSLQVLYCHCAYAQIVPKAVKDEVLQELSKSGVAFSAVADLCGMSARRDPMLTQVAANGNITIVACFPRAVKWLFVAARAPLPGNGADILNMRSDTADRIMCAIREKHLAPKEEKLPQEEGPVQGDNGFFRDIGTAEWKPWFPVIDYERCTNCLQCLSFCLFNVYGVSSEGKIQVQHESNCKAECPACSRVCPEVAILFPKYRFGPINGDEVNPEDLRRDTLKVDVSALLGGEIYAALRDRSARARSRFSKERDEDRALKERQRCLERLQQRLDIPDEVIASLPSADEIQAKSREAKDRTDAALGGIASPSQSES